MSNGVKNLNGSIKRVWYVKKKLM